MPDYTVRTLDPANVWDYENGYYWFSEPKRLAKACAHYDLYKKVVNLPGDVFELGVYKGASLIRLLSFRYMLESVDSRKVIAFDNFGDFPTDKISNKDDVEFIEKFSSDGGDGLSVSEVENILRRKNLFDNVQLHKGNVFDTLPKYFEKNPQTKISFLHLDMDVYEPTLYALELCWDRVVNGGVVMIDDYNAVFGATKAIDEFLPNIGNPTVYKSSISHIPCFIVKMGVGQIGRGPGAVERK